jgi:hypothetical protein
MTIQHPPIILGWDAVAEESLRLQRGGMKGEAAWCKAAGVARSTTTDPTQRDRVVAWVTAQPAPVTSIEVSEALGMCLPAAGNLLRAAEHRGLLRMAGVMPGRSRRLLWTGP